MKDEHDIAGRRSVQGLAYGLLAYLWWGCIPVYFKLIAHVPPLLVLAHRVVWSFVLLAAVSVLLVRWDELRAAIRNRRLLVMLSFSTVLLATNWGVFIWAVASKHVLQASLGYFINPLVSVALAVMLLKERLRAGQLAGLALAVVGVIIVTIATGRLPLAALAVAFSFAGYGLVRKLTHVGPLLGLMLETALLLPVAIIYIAWGRSEGTALDHRTFGLLLLSGIVTTVPLLAFTAAMRRLKLSTMGFLQYIVPTGQFLLAIFAFDEPFDRGKLAGFVCIWIALVVYSVDSLRGYRSNVQPGIEPTLSEI